MLGIIRFCMSPNINFYIDEKNPPTYSDKIRFLSQHRNSYDKSFIISVIAMLG